MKPKLSEVAERAEVSEATVSRVMNGKPGVADATRHRVLDVLTQLGYSIDASAAGTRTVVGLITPELDNPIFPLLAQHIESRLARHGVLSIMGPATPTTAHERDYLDYFVSVGVSGIVVVNGSYAQKDMGYAPYEQLLTRGTPVVLVNGLYLPCPVPAVGIDIAAAAQAAVAHLVNLGHTRIGCMTGPLYYSSAEAFVEGYRTALRREGLKRDKRLVVETMFTAEGAHTATGELLDRGATGIVCGSDVMALGALAAARVMGVEVPRDLSIVGFDGTPLVSLSDPPLTTLRQPVDRMAQAVTTMLMAQIGTSDRPTPQMFQAEVVAGGTAAAAPTLVAVS